MDLTNRITSKNEELLISEVRNDKCSNIAQSRTKLGR